jgi:hypothetical protein
MDAPKCTSLQHRETHFSRQKHAKKELGWCVTSTLGTPYIGVTQQRLDDQDWNCYQRHPNKLWRGIKGPPYLRCHRVVISGYELVILREFPDLNMVSY